MLGEETTRKSQAVGCQGDGKKKSIIWQTLPYYCKGMPAVSLPDLRWLENHLSAASTPLGSHLVLPTISSSPSHMSCLRVRSLYCLRGVVSEEQAPGRECRRVFARYSMQGVGVQNEFRFTIKRVPFAEGGGRLILRGICAPEKLAPSRFSGTLDPRIYEPISLGILA